MGKKRVKVVKTDRCMRWENCPHCNGKGRVPLVSDVGAWYIDYHYQDGHEVSGPYRKSEAVEIVKTHRDKTSHATLIGPDGFVYSVL